MGEFLGWSGVYGLRHGSLGSLVYERAPAATSGAAAALDPSFASRDPASFLAFSERHGTIHFARAARPAAAWRSAALHWPRATMGPHGHLGFVGLSGLAHEGQGL
jgi:hypothetical protein